MKYIEKKKNRKPFTPECLVRFMIGGGCGSEYCKLQSNSKSVNNITKNMFAEAERVKN